MTGSASPGTSTSWLAKPGCCSTITKTANRSASGRPGVARQAGAASFPWQVRAQRLRRLTRSRSGSRSTREPRAPCPRHRLQWRHLQPDRAAGQRGTRGIHREVPSDRHASPEPYERRLRRHLRPRQRSAPAVGAVPPGFTTPSNVSERIRVFAELEQTHPEMDGDERVGEVEQRSAADQRTELGGPPAPVLGASGGQVEGDHRRRGRELHVPALIPVEQPPNGGQKVTSGLPKKSEMKLMKKKPKNTTLTSSSTVCHHFGRAVLGSLRFR
jgi:hypothetical protein